MSGFFLGKGRGFLTGKHEVMKYRKGGKRIFDGINGMSGIFLGKGGGIFDRKT